MFKEKIYIVKYYHSVEDRNANSTSGIITIGLFATSPLAMGRGSISVKNRFLETKIIKEGKGIDIQIKKLEASIKGFELVDIREI